MCGKRSMFIDCVSVYSSWHCFEVKSEKKDLFLFMLTCILISCLFDYEAACTPHFVNHLTMCSSGSPRVRRRLCVFFLFCGLLLQGSASCMAFFLVLVSFFIYRPLCLYCHLQWISDGPGSGQVYLIQHILYWLVWPTGIFCGHSLAQSKWRYIYIYIP